MECEKEEKTELIQPSSLPPCAPCRHCLPAVSCSKRPSKRVSYGHQPCLLSLLPAYPGFACRITRSINSLAPLPSSSRGLYMLPSSGHRNDAKSVRAGSKSAGG